MVAVGQLRPQVHGSVKLLLLAHAFAWQVDARVYVGSADLNANTSPDSPASAGHTFITIDADTPWVVAGSSPVAPLHDDQDAAEPTAYQMALRDVQRDWYRVLGAHQLSLGFLSRWQIWQRLPLPRHHRAAILTGTVPSRTRFATGDTTRMQPRYSRLMRVRKNAQL